MLTGQPTVVSRPREGLGAIAKVVGGDSLVQLLHLLNEIHRSGSTDEEWENVTLVKQLNC